MHPYQKDPNRNPPFRELPKSWESPIEGIPRGAPDRTEPLALKTFTRFPPGRAVEAIASGVPKPLIEP